MTTAPHGGSHPDSTRATPARASDPATEPSPDATPEDLEADIARTRRDLADTVGALSERLNPKSQAKHQAEDIKAQAKHQAEDLKGRVREQAEHARLTAQNSFSQARDAAVGADGRPSPTGWIAAGAGAGALAAITALLIRRAL